MLCTSLSYREQGVLTGSDKTACQLEELCLLRPQEDKGILDERQYTYCYGYYALPLTRTKLTTFRSDVEWANCISGM